MEIVLTTYLKLGREIHEPGTRLLVDQELAAELLASDSAKLPTPPCTEAEPAEVEQELASLRAQLQELQEQELENASLRAEAEELRAEVETLREELAVLRDRSASAERQLSALQAQGQEQSQAPPATPKTLESKARGKADSEG